MTDKQAVLAGTLSWIGKWRENCLFIDLECSRTIWLMKVAGLKMSIVKNELQEIKEELRQLEEKGIVRKWSLPFENADTNLKNAVIYLTPRTASDEILIWNVLVRYPDFSFGLNVDNPLSPLMYRITFNKRDKQRNLSNY